MTIPHQADRGQTDPEQAERERADRELKARHAALWALGDFPAVAREVVAGLGAALVAAAELQTGERVLDVAAGSGNASLPAARAGARVVASDLTPELLEAGRVEAAAAGLDLEWRVADAEHLPFADGEFDVVLSCVGVMFAPHHQQAARELVRVCRPGGRIALANWTPEGFVGGLFAAHRPFSPPLPPGAAPAIRWGEADYVAGLLGSAVEDLVAVRRTLTVDRFERPEDFRSFFRAAFGPTIMAYRSVAGDPERTAALDQALLDLAREHLGQGSTMEWEYLLVTARRAG
ncbi:MAG: hypothetical protein JWP61_2826 [Friedmanniella sp.]|nr:hypothetical protein [Friedmanniella sp.]